MPELVCSGDHRRAHRPVFVSPLRPGKAVVEVNPKTESHPVPIMTLVSKVLQ